MATIFECGWRFFAPRYCCCYIRGDGYKEEVEKRSIFHHTNDLRNSSTFTEVLNMTNYYYYYISWEANTTTKLHGEPFSSGPGLLQSSMNEFPSWNLYEKRNAYTHTIFMCFLFVSKSFFLRQIGKAKLYMKNRLCQVNMLDASF